MEKKPLVMIIKERLERLILNYPNLHKDTIQMLKDKLKELKDRGK